MPCGFVIHPLLDCALDWRRDHPTASVTRVAVRGNPLLLQRTDRPEVATGRESQVSLQHAVAAALVRQGRPRPVHRRLRRRSRRQGHARARSRWRAIAALSTIAAEMDVFTVDGKKHALSTQAARGSSSNPMKDTEIEDKLRDEAKRWGPGTTSSR